jgi:hypothetical protein
MILAEHKSNRDVLISNYQLLESQVEENVIAYIHEVSGERKCWKDECSWLKRREEIKKLGKFEDEKSTHDLFELINGLFELLAEELKYLS